jgi:DNA-binding NarL/FixJ family response regulator
MSVLQNHSVIRVLIVDDHALVRNGLTALVESQADMDISGEADSAAQALAVLEQAPAHVAVVDLSLKVGNGIQLIKDLNHRHPEIRIVVSSMHEETTYAERALQAGAMAYIHKREDSHRILDAIRSVMSGRIFVSEQISNRLLTKAARGPQAAEQTSVELLTDRELQVFELIGQGFATRTIAEQLHLSPKTVDTHRQKIREKLNLENAAALSHFATQWAMKDQ